MNWQKKTNSKGTAKAERFRDEDGIGKGGVAKVIDCSTFLRLLM